MVGANTVILPNVTIGKCNIIGCGALVNKDLGDYGIYVGTPARRIKDMEPLKQEIIDACKSQGIEL